MNSSFRDSLYLDHIAERIHRIEEASQNGLCYCVKGVRSFKAGTAFQRSTFVAPDLIWSPSIRLMGAVSHGWMGSKSSLERRGDTFLEFRNRWHT